MTKIAHINAGHNPLFLISAQGDLKAKLTKTGTAVGILPNINYQIDTLHMELDDLPFTYTDGVTEARNTGPCLYRRNVRNRA